MSCNVQVYVLSNKEEKLMKKLAIAIMFIAFSLMTTGCEDAMGVCPHGVCKQKYDNPTAVEKDIPNPDKAGGGE